MRRFRDHKKITFTLAALIVAGAVAGIVATQSSGRGHKVAGMPSAKDLASINQTVLKFSSTNGETQPSSGQLYRTTRRAGIAAIGHGAILPDDSPSYLVVVRGNFTATDAPMPAIPGHVSQVPTGTWLAMLVDPTTFAVRGWSLRKVGVNLTSLGTAVPLQLSASS